MTPTPPTVAVTNLVWFGGWDAGVLLLVLFGKRSARLATLRQRTLAQWRPALMLAALAFLGLAARDIAAGTAALGAFIGDLVLPVAVFAQALIGFALARGIPKFDPLPLAIALSRRTRVLRTLLLTILVIVVAAPLGLLLGSIGTSLGASLAHETVRNSTVTTQFPSNSILAFLLLLSGAGIAEEVVYRLVMLSLVWCVTHNPWVAIAAAALLHGLYHLTPLDSFYLQFWGYPVAQVLGTICISAVWGLLYVKRGLGAAVVGHTLSDWIGVMVFLR